MITSPLIVKVAQDLKMPKERVERIVRTLQDEITKAVRAGKLVRLTNFGTFRSVTRRSRLLYNFQDPSRKRLSLEGRRLIFRPSKLLNHSLQELRLGIKRPFSSHHYIKKEVDVPVPADTDAPPSRAPLGGVPIKIIKKPLEIQEISKQLALPGIAILQKLIPYLKKPHITSVEFKKTADFGEILLGLAGYPALLTRIPAELFNTLKDNLARLFSYPAGTDWDNFVLKANGLDLMISYFTPQDTEIIRIVPKELLPIAAELNLDALALLCLKEIANQKKGLIVVSSPKHQGNADIARQIAQEFKIAPELIFDGIAEEIKHKPLAIMVYPAHNLDAAVSIFKKWPQNPKIYLGSRIVIKTCSACPAEPYFPSLEEEIKLKTALAGLNPADLPHRWHLVVQKPCLHHEPELLLESHLADDKRVSKPALRQMIAQKLISGEIITHPTIELL